VHEPLLNVEVFLLQHRITSLLNQLDVFQYGNTKGT